jgi:ferredoxin-NADP reductase
LTARLLESWPLAKEVRHFVFDVPEADSLAYRTGQFVSFTRSFGGKAVTRAYSICSPPSGNRFELCLNRVEDGLFSPWLFEAEPGTQVEMQGPLGYFTWKSPVSESVLVATGTGIAPFRAMLMEYLSAGGDQPLTLIFGVRYEESLLYRNEFERMAGMHPNFRFVPTLSRPDEGWSGARGHVQEHVLAAIGDRRDIDVYICGLRLMVDDMRARLKQLGCDRRRIVFERYD